MKHAKYNRFIHGDPDTLKRISLLYYDEVSRNKYYADGIFIDGSLLIRTDMETWKGMVKKFRFKTILYLRSKETLGNRLNSVPFLFSLKLHAPL